MLVEQKTSFNAPKYGLLKVSGQDAAKFLQGQLTCDVIAITPKRFYLAAHCNPKGRIISLFRITVSAGEYYLLLPACMLSIAEAALKKYAIFYKTNLSEASLDLFSEEIKTFSHTANLLAGIPHIYPETSEVFMPHELNLHEQEAISFNKGCYTGQEIIARIHYRGKLKKRLYRARIIKTASLQPGASVYYREQGEIKTAGTIVDCGGEQYNNYIALILMDEALSHTELFLENADCNFELLDK